MAETALRPKLGDILVRLQLVDAEQVQAALEHQARSGKLFGESLLDLGFIGQDDLSWALSSQLGLPFVAVSADMADPALLSKFPAEFLRRNLVLPLVASETSLSVVLADPTDRNTVARLERIAGSELNLAVGTPAAIRGALDSIFGGEPEIPGESRAPGPESGRMPPPSLSSPDLATLLDRALGRGAVLVHLDPDGKDVRVRFRDASGGIHDGGAFSSGTLREMVRGLDTWVGAGATRIPGIAIWGDSADQASNLPFRIVAMESDKGTSLTLVLEGIAPDRLEASTDFEEEWSRFDPLLRRPNGLVVAVAPTPPGRALLLSRLTARLDPDHRRLVGLVPGTVSLPRGTIRFAREASAQTVSTLSRLEGVDGILGSFEDESLLHDLVPAAARDRLVLAAFPGNAALGFLARIIGAGISPVHLAETLRAVVALQVLPGSGDSPARAVTETLFIDRPLRRALQNGGSVDALREAAVEQGFLEMAARLRGADSVEPAALADLDRLRFLEDAA